MMRRAVDPGRLDQIFPAQEETRALRSAYALASAVGDESRAVLQMYVRNGQDLGGSVRACTFIPPS